MKPKTNTTRKVWLLLLAVCIFGFILRWGVDLHNGWLAQSLTRPPSQSNLPSDTVYQVSGGSISCYQTEQSPYDNGKRWCGTKRELTTSSASNPSANAEYYKNDYQDLVRKGWKQYFSYPNSVNPLNLPSIYQVDLQYRSTKSSSLNSAGVICKADTTTKNGKEFSKTTDCSWRAALSLAPQTLLLHAICLVIIWLVWRATYKRGKLKRAKILLGSLVVLYALFIARYALAVNFLAMPPKANKNVSLQKSTKPQGATVADKVDSVWATHSYLVLQGSGYELAQRKIEDTPGGCPCLRSRYITTTGSEFEVEEHYGDSRYSARFGSSPVSLTTNKGIATLYQISDAQRQDTYIGNGDFTAWILFPASLDDSSMVKIINDLSLAPASDIQLL